MADASAGVEEALERAPAATRAYVAACRENPDGPLGRAMASAPLPSAYRSSWGDRLLPQPCFLERSEAEATAADCVRLMELLTELPGRLFGGDLDAYGAALGMPRERRVVLREGTRSVIPPFGRVDMYHDGIAFRVLEVNFATDLGALDRSELARSLLEVPAVADFALRFEASHIDTVARLAVLLRAAARRDCAPGEEVEAAIVCGRGDRARYAELLAGLVEAMEREAVNTTIAELDEIEVEADAVILGGRRVEVVYRFFTVDDLTGDPLMIAQAMALLRASEDGSIGLVSSWDTSWFSNKGALALLSTAAAGGLLGDADADLVARRLPWTRLLSEKIRDEVHTRRSELLLKPTRDFGGAGIHVGRELDDREWRSCVERALESSYIVQQLVRPRAEVMVEPGTGALSSWWATWGLFVLDGEPAGLDVRALPSGAGAVINYGGDSRTRTTGVFVVGAG